MRRSAIAVAVALAAAAVSTGCSGDTSSDGPRPTDSPTATTTPSTGGTGEPTAVPQAEAIGRIDIDGADGSPITWQLPDGAQPTDPVGVAQRYFAIIRQAGTPGTEVGEDLIASVTEDDYVAVPTVRLREAQDEGLKTSGPQWIWIDEADERGDLAFVHACADVGHFQPAGTATPATDRALALYAELRRVEEPGGTEVWKVSRYNAGPVNDADPFEERCPAWASHQP